MTTSRIGCRPAQAGFSLVEMVVVMGLVGVLSAMAVLQINASRPGLKGDGAMRVVLSQMTAARELAITQRRNVRVTFTAGILVQTIREDAPAATQTTLSSVSMEGGLQFAIIAGLGDTPDNFCNGSVTAVSFPTATGTPPEVKFTPDGTFVNQLGHTLNGTVFVSLPDEPTSARAVTILGATGRVRGYRWDGRAWMAV
ncbi:MAG: prepilin-type N-terminal cleavage/methylation domain-containing protein [Acidobacteriota bacterium]